MDELRGALTQTPVLVAIITGILGPVALALINWATTKRRAEKDARSGQQPDGGPENVSGMILGFATELRKEMRGLREEVHRLRDRVYQLEDENDALTKRIGHLERENDRLALHNKQLVSQVLDLGGKPWPAPE